MHPTLEESLMPDMVLLTDAELDLVAGGGSILSLKATIPQFTRSAYASSFNSGDVSAYRLWRW